MDIIAPPFYHRYIDLVKADPLPEALSKNTRLFISFLQQIPPGKQDYAYAPGKWTVRQVLQHVLDAERVFAFRALWFARKDAQPLPGFDENPWAESAPASGRSWNEMTEEFHYLRRSTELLFASFNGEALAATGTSNNNVASVAAFGYMCAGHVQHHMQVMAERYL